MADISLSLALAILAVDKASPTVQGLGKTLQQVMSTVGPGAMAVGQGLLAAGQAAVGFGEQAVTSAAGYQQAMLKNVALAGLSQSSYQDMTNKIMAMAPEVGQAPQALANGLYNVLSAGVPAANALDVMKLSAEAAATGMTDTQTITDGLTSAMNAMSIPFSKTANVMADLTATVSGGKMTWQNLASSVGMLSVTAHEAGISLQDATAGLATMTDSGMSANRAGMDLDFLMRDLGMNVDKVALNAKKMGLGFDETTFKTMSLMDKLRYLQQITNGNASEMMKLTGGATGMAAAQAILTNNGQLYAGILGKINTAYQQGTMTQESFKTTQQGLNQQLAQLNAAWQVLLITVGNLFLPLVTKLVIFITPLVQDFANWINSSNFLTLALRNVGGALAPLGGLMQNIQGAFAAMDPAVNKTTTTMVNGFGQVITKAPQAAAATKPLLDTFDRASAVIGATTVKFPVLADTFDRASKAIAPLPYNVKRTADALQPMNDSFDRASTIIPTTTVKIEQHTAAVQRTTAATNPLIAAWQAVVAYYNANLAPTINGLIKQFQSVSPELLTLGQLFLAVLGLILEVATNTFSSIIGIVGGTVDNLLQIIGIFVDMFTGKWNEIPGRLYAIWQNVQKIIGDAISLITGQAPGWGEQIIQGFINGIASMLPAIGNVMSKVLGALTPTPHAPSVPHFAGGVTNFSGGFAVVGEQGPELVFLPGGSSVLPQTAATPTLATYAPAGGGGGHVFAPQIIINVPPGRLDQASAKQIGDVVIQYVSQQFLRSGVMSPTFKGL